jgi:small subunit ribosomal protein S6
MAASTTIYDLILMLDLAAEDDVRAKIVADARTAIGVEGTLVGEQAWGVRTLAYPIDHRTQAEYHLLQFSGPPSLIAGLEHTLRITDGVVRHRVIKQPRGTTPVAADEPGPAPTPPPAAESDPEPVGA